MEDVTSREELLREILKSIDQELILEVVILGQCDPKVLIEYVAGREAKKLSHMNPGTAMNNLIKFEVINDITHCLEDRLHEISLWDQEQRFPDAIKNDPLDLEDKIRKYEGKWGSDFGKTNVDIPEVDMAVNATGNTKLHEAVKDGDIDTVIHLVDIEGADTTVKDNSDWTPYDVAIQRRDRKEIAEYLKQYPH